MCLIKKYKILFLLFLLFLFFVIFLLNLPERSRVIQWSTSSAINGDLIQSFVRMGNREVTHNVERLIFQNSQQPHAGYLFIRENELRLKLRADDLEWFIQGNFLKIRKPSSFQPFSYQGKVFKLYSRKEVCVYKSGRLHSQVALVPGTFPYCYAAANGAVVVCSNWGEVLLYKDEKWVRMSVDGDIYSKHSPCVFKPDEKEPPLSTARGIQFYCSVVFEGQTLLGVFPTGCIYVFDGSTLRPWAHQPWKALERNPNDWRDYSSFELQSLAVFCGDLYAGFWPKGEIWRFSSKTKTWHFVTSLFTPYDIQPFRDKNFFGVQGCHFLRQRICSMVPYGDGLYVSTGNYNAWPADYRIEGMSQKTMDEYGAVYKIQRNDCLTETSPSFLRNLYLILSRTLYKFLKE